MGHYLLPRLWRDTTSLGGSRLHHITGHPALPRSGVENGAALGRGWKSVTAARMPLYGLARVGGLQWMVKLAVGMLLRRGRITRRRLRRAGPRRGRLTLRQRVP